MSFRHNAPSPEATQRASAETQKAGRVAFQHPAFVYFQAARLVAVIGLEMQSVAVGWQVYEITRQPLALGYVGLAQFLPGLLLFLITGHAADRYNRRTLLVICHAGFALSSALLFFATRDQAPEVSRIYAIMVLVGVVRAFSGPSSRSILQMLVPDHHFGNAIAWNATFFQASVLIGPALGGLAYSFLGGPGAVYAGAMLSAVVAAALMWKVHPRPARERVVDSIWAGLRYIRHQKIVLGSISLDLFAVLFGGAVALLPVYASEILHTGPWGLGLLRSSPAVGAAAMAVILAFRPVKKRVGPTLFVFVALFGVFTILFGLSRNLWLSMAALFMVGACDMVSIIIRNMLVQMSTPDQMRGRVTAIELIFIGASNELGEFESGITAHWLGAVPAVLAGGIGSLLVVAVWAYAFPALRQADEFTRVPDQAAPDEPARRPRR